MGRTFTTGKSGGISIEQLYDEEEERTIDLEGEDLMPEAEFCIF